MRSVVLAACLSILPTIVFAQTAKPAMRDTMDDTLGKLAWAKNIEELKNAWANSPDDFPHRAIHSARYFTFGAADRETVLMNSLPANGQQMIALYYAQDTIEGQDMAVTEAYNNYYNAVSEVVVKHPHRLPQFLRMIHAFHATDNVDEWPWLCGLASRTYKAAPKLFLRAVKQIEPEYRQEALDCRTPPDAP